MAKRERSKRSARKARAQERSLREAAQAASTPEVASAGKAVQAEKPAKAVAKSPKAKGTGPIARLRGYFSDVRTELHKVVWPSRDELANYSVAVVAMLVVFGLVIWLVDSGIVAALVGYTGLRG